MAWSSLASRIRDIPLVLAGPILRQVTADAATGNCAVTVWVALQQSCDVILTVYDKDQGPTRRTLMQGQRETTGVGKNLHIVAVTARAQHALTEGKIYFYDLQFKNQTSHMEWTLAEAITPSGATQDMSRLVYNAYALPSFALPPADLNKVRLVHGSCRKPHGGGKVAPDALAMLNALIANDASDPYLRPHQLFLTGDQIYADEVEEALLAALTDAGDTLLGWTKGPAGSRVDFPESLPGISTDGPYQASKLAPSTRSPLLLKAGLTSEDTRSHLMSLGEFFAMYLFVWSEELWTTLPTIVELNAMLPPGTDLTKSVAADITARRPAIDNFRKTLKDVRRALANIPTYMIFDDHEITDDWNMTRGFCDGVYGNPLGRRLIQNGLIAYSIFQAWGNLPEQFEKDVQEPAGLKLLNLLKSASEGTDNAARYDSLELQLAQLVGIHQRSQMSTVNNGLRVFHEATGQFKVRGVTVSTSSLRFHFSVEASACQVIVTDTRTWRFFRGSDPKPTLLYDQMDTQLRVDVPALGSRQLLLVCSTNAPQLATLRMLGRITTSSDVNERDIFDSWDLPSLGFDALIVGLTDKISTGPSAFAGSVVILSGDIHFSFASRLTYWSEIQRLDDMAGHAKKGELVVAQLVCSSLKNEQSKTIGEQVVGYTYMPPAVEAALKKVAVFPGGAPIAGYVYYSGVAPPHEAESYAGWNVPADEGRRKVGRLKAGWVQSGETLYASSKAPTQPTNLNYLKEVTLTKKPDYRYRIDFLTTVQIGQTAPGPPAAVPVTSTSRADAARSHAIAAAAHRDVIARGATPPDCIGYNNLAEISFVLQPVPGQPNNVLNRRVRQLVRWQQPYMLPLWALYDVSLNVADPAFPPIRAQTEPP
jgi:hypothetical protein